MRKLFEGGLLGVYFVVAFGFMLILLVIAIVFYSVVFGFLKGCYQAIVGG